MTDLKVRISLVMPDGSEHSMMLQDWSFENEIREVENQFDGTITRYPTGRVLVSGQRVNGI